MKPKLFEKIRCFAVEAKAKKTIAGFLLVLLTMYLSHAIAMKPNKSLSTTGQMSGAVANNKAAGPLLQAPTAAKPEMLEAYGKLPLSFEANRGQTDAQVKFLSRGRGYTMFLTRRAETVLVLRNPSPKSDASQPARLQLAAARPKPEPVTSPVVVRMKLDGANAAPQVEGLEELPSKANYFIGNDPAKWRTNVPTYARVQYHAVYPGVDLVYYGNQHQLEHDFIVAAGADPGAIALRLKGAEKLSLDVQGDLVLMTKNGEVRFTKPVIYQEMNGARQEIAGRYTLKGRDRVGFAVAAYDVTKPLVIDPGLVYSTFLGGAGADQGFAIAVDSSGAAYVTGRTGGGTFPTPLGAFDTSHNGGGDDAFVTKLNAAGSALVYSTYLGGSGLDQGHGIAVDFAGDAYVIGVTASSSLTTGFPTTVGAFDTTYNGGASDAFVSKLDPTGSTLVYSTFLGGGGTDEGWGIAVDATDAYVTGLASAGFPTTTGAFDTSQNGLSDAFVSKLNPSLTGVTSLVYSTFLGGNGSEQGYGIAVALGEAYVTGLTNSSSLTTGFPTTVGAFDTSHNGNNDVFVSKLNTIGSALVYSTFLGGSGNDQGRGIAVDGTGAYVTGVTASPGFPFTVGAYDTVYNGGDDVFVTKLNAIGSMLVYSTFLGGSGNETGLGIAVDTGGAYVTGQTNSGGFPTTSDAVDMVYNGGDDVFVSKLNVTGSMLLYSTFLGGSSTDRGMGIAVDSSGIYVTGLASAGFPTTLGAFDTSFNGGFDAFVSKLSVGPGPPATLTLSPKTDTNEVGDMHTVTATVKDSSGNPTPGIVVRFSVSGANTASGTDTTDANGEATFTYTGTVAGTDTISAFADTNNNTMQDTGEPGDTATKTWTPGPPATLTLSPKTATNVVGNMHTVTATVKDSFGNPTPGIVVRFSVSGANTASGSNATDLNGQATFSYTGTVTGTDTISAFADTNNNTIQDTGEPGDTATKRWTPGPPFSLTLTPPTATNVVGTTHCVTATVKDSFGNPTPGITVVFSVPTSVATFASPSSGSATTDGSGQAMFCFSASLPGADAIHAFADFNPKNGTQDTGEPFGDATKTWTPPPSTAFCEVTITNGGWFIANNGDRTNFGGNAKVAGDGTTVQGQEQYQDQGPAQPRNVHSIELTATTCSNDGTMASIFGRATINGSGSFVFRIDVMDQGEPGRNDTYGIMMSDGYASGQHKLKGGNVTIHK